MYNGEQIFDKNGISGYKTKIGTSTKHSKNKEGTLGEVYASPYILNYIFVGNRHYKYNVFQ